MWIQPIYDRTQEDIDNRTSKGYLNVSDLNRIENNIKYVGELMGKTINSKTWNLLSLPTTEDFNRIEKNINELEASITFTAYENYPQHPINTFGKVNTIESLIASIKGDWELILGSRLYCGDSSYGNDNLI